jgi:hypothetical protein
MKNMTCNDGISILSPTTEPDMTPSFTDHMVVCHLSTGMNTYTIGTYHIK